MAGLILTVVFLFILNKVYAYNTEFKPKLPIDLYGVEAECLSCGRIWQGSSRNSLYLKCPCCSNVLSAEENRHIDKDKRRKKNL